MVYGWKLHVLNANFIKTIKIDIYINTGKIIYKEYDQEGREWGETIVLHREEDFGSELDEMR